MSLRAAWTGLLLLSCAKPAAPEPAARPPDAAPVAVAAPPAPPDASPPDAVPATRVELHVEVKHVGKDAPYAYEAALTQRLAGVNLAPSGSQPTAGVVTVTFNEREGDRLTDDPTGQGSSIGRRTIIAVSVEVAPTGGKAQKLSLEGWNGSLSMEPGESLYTASVDERLQAKDFGAVAPFIALALGDESVANQLAAIVLATSGGTAKSIIALLGAHPAALSDASRAAVAVAGGNFDECIAIGAAAVDPLYEALSNSGWGYGLGGTGIVATGARRGATHAFVAIPATTIERIEGLLSDLRNEPELVGPVFDELALSGRPEAAEVIQRYAAGDNYYLAQAAKRAQKKLKKSAPGPGPGRGEPSK